MSPIERVEAWEVLDSRGEPTVRAAVAAGGERGTFTVPAGASTGTYEAVERRDGGDRYGGRGVREAVTAAEGDLADAVLGREVTDQRGVDAALRECDGTEDLSRLGANAVLAVSGAVAHAAATVEGLPLYRSLGDDPGRLPTPMANVLSGGRHAAGGTAVQDFLVVPVGADSYPSALETVWQVRETAREAVRERGERPLVADEGGFAPALDTPEEGFDLLVEAIEAAGSTPGDDVAIAVDVAASEIHDADGYALSDESLDREAMIERVASWVREYPLVSVEDPLGEDDWTGWRRLADCVGDVQLLGDDLLVTDGERLERAIEADAAGAVLIKPNQAGTLTDAVDVLRRARAAGMGTVVSARSGESCDATIADLAVALDAGQIKVGSLARSERLAKYNRLRRIAGVHDGGFDGGAALGGSRPRGE